MILLSTQYWKRIILQMQKTKMDKQVRHDDIT